jgi:CHAD domain-containing protein
VRVEVALDRTSASSGRARRRWTELEVELKQGPEEAFSRLVSDLRRASGLAPVDDGKLARILGAAGKAVPSADEIALARLAGPGDGPGALDPAPAALRRVLAAGARRLERALAGGLDADSVHDVRTSSRRLRSILRLFREADEAKRDEARSALRALARAAGALRDEQMALDSLHEGPDWARGNAALAAAIGARAKAAAARLRRRLDDAETRSLPRRVAELGARAEARRSEPFAVAGAARVPRESERALADVARLVPTRASPEGLHALRLSVKRARYAAEAFSGAFGAPVGRFIAAARRLQDDLGLVQDEVSLRAALRRALARLPARSPDREAAARAAEAALADASRRTQAALERLPARIEAAFGEKAQRRLGAHLLGRAARASAASAAAT